MRTHQLHAFAIGSADIERHLNFRDYLRAHPAEARAYETLKRALAAQSLGDGGAYGDGKTDFVARWNNAQRYGAAIRQRGEAGVRPP